MSTPTNLVVSSWMEGRFAGEPPFVMTRPAEPRSNTALLVRDVVAFTGGEPNAWSSETIKQVADWREPFGNDGSINRCDLVVVPCPELNYHELRTPEFLAAWKQFAFDNGVSPQLYYEATANTLTPRDARKSDFAFGVADDQDFGADNDPTVYIMFFTKELCDLVGPIQYWTQVINAMGLDWGTYYDPLRQSIDVVNGGKMFTPEDLEFFTRTFAREPERLLGIYDTFWNDVLNRVRHVTVVRFERNVIVEDDAARWARRTEDPGRLTNAVTGSVFAIETDLDRGRRHRGGR